MIDLDKEACVLCQYNVPVLNNFLDTTFDSLVRKCTIDQLYDEMEKAIKINKSLLVSQGIQTPEITALQLKIHFTELCVNQQPEVNCFFLIVLLV